MGLLLRLLVGVPLLILLALFALSNPTPVRLTLWPTDFALDAPLSLAILVLTGTAFLVGALFVWVNELGQRHRARQAEHTVKLLEVQLQDLKARLPTGP